MLQEKKMLDAWADSIGPDRFESPGTRFLGDQLLTGPFAVVVRDARHENNRFRNLVSMGKRLYEFKKKAVDYFDKLNADERYWR